MSQEMNVIALYSIKGGVGKTTTCINLAYESARAGYRTLVWDLDPQGAASFYFRIKPKLKGGVKRVMRNYVGEGIKASDFDNLDLLPADFTYRNLDLALDQQKHRKRTLKQRLAELSEEYDNVFLDCAPGLTLVSENIFRAANLLLQPLIPTTLSLRTNRQLDKFLSDNREQDLTLLSFFSMVDRRRKMHREIVDNMMSREDVLGTVIPASSMVEKMGTSQAPVGVYSPRSGAACAYGVLWREIETRMGWVE